MYLQVMQIRKSKNFMNKIMETIKELTVKDLLSSGEYRIPIYQRNYAWGVDETTQLIEDIADYAKGTPESNYYIGNLIVFPRFQEGHWYYETIDGQQRTTTLTILMCALKHKYALKYKDDVLSWYSKVNITFDHREKSNRTLDGLFNNQRINADITESGILTVFNKARGIIDETCKNKDLDVSKFIKYFLKRVIILRICVPQDTNLNHYFEIMNSRGEQLEQHEIVKAKLMSSIRSDKRAMTTFNLIWEACSDMDRYLQLNFSKEVRLNVFENHGTEAIKITFDEFKNSLCIDDASSDIEEKSFVKLFEDANNNIPYLKPWDANTEKEQEETFHSLITFPNFLLHVLKIMYPHNTGIVLDDKRLSSIFDSIIDQSTDKAGFVIEFIENLLKLRFIFDKYIIKTKQDKWSLKKLLPQKNDKDKYYYKDTFSQDDSEVEDSVQNREVIMLQSMFHVSAPTQIYKHWMNACLYFVYKHRDVGLDEYVEYLFKLSKSYMLDRYLAPANKKIPFETIIYDKNGKPTNEITDVSWENINIGDCPKEDWNVENFVFNFCDYLLWKSDKNIDFEFSYRTSVEHFYPQHPTDRKAMDSMFLNSFGNLCLISSSMNSKFTNNLPGAKLENFGDAEAMKTYSLKLREMMRNAKEWNETTIKKKEEEFKDLIEQELRE